MSGGFHQYLQTTLMFRPSISSHDHRGHMHNIEHMRECRREVRAHATVCKIFLTLKCRTFNFHTALIRTFNARTLYRSLILAQ